MTQVSQRPSCISIVPGGACDQLKKAYEQQRLQQAEDQGAISARNQAEIDHANALQKITDEHQAEIQKLENEHQAGAQKLQAQIKQLQTENNRLVSLPTFQAGMIEGIAYGGGGFLAIWLVLSLVLRQFKKNFQVVKTKAAAN